MSLQTTSHADMLTADVVHNFPHDNMQSSSLSVDQALVITLYTGWVTQRTTQTDLYAVWAGV